MERVFSTVVSPFSADVETAPDSLQLELIDLQADNELQMMFKHSDSLVDFYKFFQPKTLFISETLQLEFSVYLDQHIFVSRPFRALIKTSQKTKVYCQMQMRKQS